MTQADTKQRPSSGKGKAFFDRADQVAGTGNWDFAVEMYVEGINREPENLERGHKRLRDVALKRKAQGGKGPGMMEQLKRRPGKDPHTNLVNASYLLAKEPGSVAYMEQVLKSAIALGLADVKHWICDVLLEVQRQTAKPSKRVCVLLAECFREMEEFGKGVQACEIAHQLDPGDGVIQNMLRDMSAQYTIKKGKYDQEGDFTRAVKDMDEQQELTRQDALVQDREFLDRQITRARREYLESPTVAGKINAVVDALLKIEEEGFENEAIDILNKAFKDTSAFQFKSRVGDVRVRQMTRRYRALLQEGQKEAAAEQARKQLAYELEMYAERAANYPTDLALKYELGRRQFLSAKLDDSIASFQAAARDPHRHVSAMTYLGQAFAKKGWLREAVETFRRALESEMSEERQKELRYFLGDALEQSAELEGARGEFSKVAQLDYNFKDVRDRLEGVRKKMEEAKGAAGSTG